MRKIEIDEELDVPSRIRFTAISTDTQTFFVSTIDLRMRRITTPEVKLRDSFFNIKDIYEIGLWSDKNRQRVIVAAGDEEDDIRKLHQQFVDQILHGQTCFEDFRVKKGLI